MGRWRREAGVRLDGARDLDRSKVQAPCIVRRPEGGYRLFYTAVGPGKPFAACQGYILSAVSEDGLSFETEQGIRVAPVESDPQLSRRVLAPSVTALPDRGWRMYFEARGLADQPTAICSAISRDQLDWQVEPGIRLQAAGGVGGPRYLPVSDRGGQLFCFSSEYDSGGVASGRRISTSIVSAVTTDGLSFSMEPGYRLRDGQGDYDSAGITAATVLAPREPGGPWTMIYSAWQDVPAGTIVPPHPSLDRNAGAVDFAAASIAADMAGYRSRIYAARSADGVTFSGADCLVDGGGHDATGRDAVHAEDMSVIALGAGQFRMYYAACDGKGRWRIASAVSEGDAP